MVSVYRKAKEIARNISYWMRHGMVPSANFEGPVISRHEETVGMQSVGDSVSGSISDWTRRYRRGDLSDESVAHLLVALISGDLPAALNSTVWGTEEASKNHNGPWYRILDLKPGGNEGGKA
ncbi:MAG: hypothetical protein HY514_03850 [Candidatus Aenigmarchaeota archaeon]|nr:hypothetical protein [Candidatus Aenigmarchaeota archaeon]